MVDGLLSVSLHQIRSTTAKFDPTPRDASMPSDLPGDVHQFLSEYIQSISQLELLLLLRGNAEKRWTVEDAAKELYTPVSMTLPMLESLRAIGLLSSGDSGAWYQYAPKSEDLQKLVENLAQLYIERRVTIINTIYSGPLQKLQNFADAFRLRRKEEE
jgi:hypothetical protein